MRKSFKYKARLSPSAQRNAQYQLDLLRELYNAALEHRIEAWKRARVSVTLYDQINELTEIRRIREDVGALNRTMCEETLKNLDAAFRIFFGRGGFPRFRSRSRFDSMRYRTQGGGYKLSGRRLTLAGVGTCKLFLSRPVEGRIKTVTLRRDAVGDWWVTFSCDDVPARALPATGKSVGVDVGLLRLATLSDGLEVENPRYTRNAEADLARAMRKLSKRKRGGSRRNRQRIIVARKHRRVANCRRDFLFKTALQLVREYDFIAVEDLNIRGLARTRMAKSIHDASWGTFIRILSFKAEEAGKTVVAVNARGTSQACSGCGCEVRKTLATRIHRCDCGLTLDRDVNAARNIFAEAQRAASRLASKAAA